MAFDGNSNAHLLVARPWIFQDPSMACIWKHNSTARYSKLQDFDPGVFVQHKAVILVAATYGEGDPTDNAAEFYKWIHDDSHEPECLKGMHYTVMGLGNRQTR